MVYALHFVTAYFYILCTFLLSPKPLIYLDLAVPNRVPAHRRILIKLQRGHILLRQAKVEDLGVIQDA